MNTTNEYRQMWESLQDIEFRKQLIDEHINVGIAFQIHGLRKRQGLIQKQLAEKLGEKKQPLISPWENPTYGKYTLGTLKDLAKAFDVGLLVRFVPFSKLIDWTLNLTSDVIAPPSFSEEQYNVASSVSVATELGEDTMSVADTKDTDAYTLYIDESVPSVNSATTTTEKKRKGVLVHA